MENLLQYENGRRRRNSGNNVKEDENFGIQTKVESGERGRERRAWREKVEMNKES